MVVLAASPAFGGTFEFWYGNTGAAGAEIQRQCRTFNASQSAHQVTCVGLGSYEATLQRAAAAYRAGRQPALVQAFDAATQEMAESGATLPVEPFLRQRGLQVRTADYPAAVAAAYAGRDGLQALPYNVSTLVLYVNLDKLARVGAGPPATWQAFEATARRLKATGESCPFAYRLDPWWWLEQASAVAGEPIATLANGQGGLGAAFRFESGVHRQMMADLRRWSRDGLAVLFDASALGSPQRAFASGRCAMVLESSGAAAGFAASGFRAAAAPLPRYAERPRRASLPGGAALWLMKGQSPAAYDGAAAFLAFVRRPDQQAAMARATGYLPLSAAARAISVERLGGLQAQTVEVAVASLDAGGARVPTPRLGFYVRFRELWREEMQRVFSGRQTLETGLGRASRRGDNLLRRFEQIYGRMG